MPALLTSTDGAPCSLATCSTKRRTLWVSFTSSSSAATLAPPASRLATAASRFAASRAPITTNRSAAASWRAVPRPMPRMPPVPMARRLAGMHVLYHNVMPKVLRAGRLGYPDDDVFRLCGAARDGEWVVAGAYAACKFDVGPRCDPPCHCE